MKLSDQGAAALLMCLQKCIAEEIDIMPLLKDLDFIVAFFNFCSFDLPHKP